MKNIKYLFLVVMAFLAFGANGQTLSKGVTKELAAYRKANVSDVLYDLTFRIPANPNEKVTGRNIITFDLKERGDVILDFQGELTGCYVYAGKKKNKRKLIPVTYKDEHIIIPMKALQAGQNKVELNFTSLDKALNRHQDYMYSLFVPDKARSVFPCFDQPDLRARYLTDIKAPSGWKTMTSDGCCPIPTYLYSFAAGNFQEKKTMRNGKAMRALYRETDPDKVAQLDKVFDEASQALQWMEGYTGIACPFGNEFGLLILPGYQFGGMEHPGAIQLSDRRVFLERNATQEELLHRTELIAHEVAHLWFGDFVSLKWFEDVWAKEVFANFMAAKITRRSYNKVDHDLNFLKTYQARAIAIDRTEGTHPIAQELVNLDHASLLYDNIIYDKAPVMMRMLEQMMGAPVMQSGLQRYLSEHAYNNASWDDLIKVLDEVAPSVGVRQFSEVWVKQKGMPTIHTSYQDGKIIVSQIDPYGRGLCWRQKFQIYLINDRGGSKTLDVDMQQPTMTFKVARQPDYIIPNYNGQGYGRFTLDEEYSKLLPMRLITTRNDLARYSLLLTIYDNYLLGNIPPSYFGELYRLMMKEKNPLIMSTAIDHMAKIAYDLTPQQRTTLELCIMDLLGENKSDECRQFIIRKLGACATSPDVLTQINKLWESHNDPLFGAHDYMEMAYRQAIMNPDKWEQILSAERARLKTDELREEFDYVSRACNPNADSRIALFNEILKPENRKHEPWALRTLRLLNSDVFEPQSNAYIEPSLSSLPYIQQTSDIFFPGNWMKALLEAHKSPEAKQLIENFAKSSGNCPDNLRNKVLEAGWVLTKQGTYVEKAKPTVVNLGQGSKAPAKPAPKKATPKRRR
ncbi:MAG: ERAP1-like C-terminal domain-containing protein [Prevotella sp.]|nr:ERAP1-like C-terminal domain-containing protein [Prevotella sp.]